MCVDALTVWRRDTLVALHLTSPWALTYEFARLGTLIRIRDETAGRLANDFALGTVIVIRCRMLTFLQMTSGYGGMIASTTTMRKQSLGK